MLDTPTELKLVSSLKTSVDIFLLTDRVEGG